jgi:hypothetical protein
MTDLEREVLDFAALRWKYNGAQATAIRERFDWTSTHYFQVLNALLDEPDALIYAPQTVARLRRLREVRRMGRQAS